MDKIVDCVIHNKEIMDDNSKIIFILFSNILTHFNHYRCPLFEVEYCRKASFYSFSIVFIGDASFEPGILLQSLRKHRY